MPESFWSAKTSRKIIARVVVEGDLVLETPAHLGSGDGDDLTDMLLLLDPLEGKALLTGSTLAGALRSYLRSRERGYLEPLPDPTSKSACHDERESATVKLFGGFKGDDTGEQSPLIVDDALGIGGGIELRSGVRLNPESRTAAHRALFDLQLWQAGTRFQLRLELVIREDDDASQLRCALVSALEGFKDGSITLGARKRRGYGRITVENWRGKTYDLKTADGLLDWIEKGDQALDARDIMPTTNIIDDARTVFSISATFALDGSLLIRSGGGKDDLGPDMVHLHARQANGSTAPVLSGTSLAGALRARALRIAKTLGEETEARALLYCMFGPEMEADCEPWASRVIVEEHVIEHARTDLVQSRVSLDRFTGGARKTALFTEQPAFDMGNTKIAVDVRLIKPENHEIGLLLLLLKDLWTGDLPLGGEQSIGRGRLKGSRATIMHRHGHKQQTWELCANGEGLTISGDQDALEGYVTRLGDFLKGEAA